MQLNEVSGLLVALGICLFATEVRPQDRKPDFEITIDNGKCVVTKAHATAGALARVVAKQPLKALTLKLPDKTLRAKGAQTAWVIERPTDADGALSGTLSVEFAGESGEQIPAECGQRQIFSARASAAGANANEAAAGGAGTTHSVERGSVLSSELARFDTRASRWWLQFGSSELLELRRKLYQLSNDDGAAANQAEDATTAHDAHLLVHLPSGAEAAPFDGRMTEGEAAQVVLIVPTYVNMAADVQVTGCQAVRSFRIQSDDSKGKKQAKGEEPEVTRESFELRPVGKLLRCGPTEFTYSIQTKLILPPAPAGSRQPAEGDAASQGSLPNTTITVGARNHLAAVAILGYASTPTVSFVKRTDRSDDTAPVTIATERDRRGVAVYAGALWSIGGVDYGNMKWYNHFANLFVAVNPTGPLDDVVAGLSATVTGGVSLALGVNLLRGVRLDDYGVGNEFAGDGDIPTRKTWREAKVGVFAGLAIDSDIYEALVKTE